MKRIITTIALLMTLGATLYAQLPTFEWRLENEQLVSSKVYSLDVYLYNTGASSFEVRGGTIAFLVNTSWTNGGTLTVSTPSSGLVAGQQGSTASFSGTAPAYFRKIITTVGSGTGTSIPAGSRVKCFTINLTNTVDYSTSATPNFAWKFNAAPAAGFNYDNGGSNVAVVSNTGTSQVTANQAFCYTPTYWTGSAWNTGSKTAGSVSTSAPDANQDVVIFNGTMTQSGTMNCRNLNILAGTTHDVGGANVLNVYGNIVQNGTFTVTSGEVALYGTGSKTISGSASKFAVNGIAFRSAGTYSTSMPIEITNRIADISGGGFTLAANGGLKLISTANGTALIGALSSGTSITGTITAERYIPANGRRWRFLASPVVGGTTLQWRDNGGNTSGRGTNITGTTGTVDFNIPNPSVLRYNESSAVGGSNINAKWEAIDGSSALTNGRGYRAFIRGDRSDIPANSSNHATTLWVSGTNPTSPVNVPVTFNGSLGNGWNLIGNPYPCPIDLIGGGITSSALGSATVWVWNPVTNSYGSFDGVTPTNGVTRYIASGQAFFVQASSTGNVTFSESAKVSNTPSNMFKAAERNSLRMTLVKDATESDETVVRFMDSKSDEFNNTDDVAKPMMNPAVNISSYFGTDKYAIVNYMNTKSMDAKVIPLGASVTEVGTYDLNFAQVDGFDANINIYLKDNYNNTITDLRQNSKYAFNVDSKAESTMDGRLELIFVNKTSSIESVLAGRTANMNVYPNPAVDVLNVEITNANFKQSEVSIFNVSGVEVMNNNMMGNKKSLDIQKLSSGVYFVRVSNMETGFVNTVKFVK